MSRLTVHLIKCMSILTEDIFANDWVFRLYIENPVYKQAFYTYKALDVNRKVLV